MMSSLFGVKDPDFLLRALAKASQLHHADCLPKLALRGAPSPVGCWWQSSAFASSQWRVVTDAFWLFLSVLALVLACPLLETLPGGVPRLR